MKNKITFISICCLLLVLISACQSRGGVKPVTEADSASSLQSLAQSEADVTMLNSARSLMDVKVCDNISTESVKNDCFDLVNYDLAVSQNQDTCNRIQNTDLKAACDAKIAEFKQLSKEQEFFNKAQADENPRFCAQITNPTDQDDCYINLAYKTKDPQLCEQLTDPASKQTCAEQL